MTIWPAFLPISGTGWASPGPPQSQIGHAQRLEDALKRAWEQPGSSWLAPDLPGALECRGDQFLVSHNLLESFNLASALGVRPPCTHGPLIGRSFGPAGGLHSSRRNQRPNACLPDGLRQSGPPPRGPSLPIPRDLSPVPGVVRGSQS